VLTYGRSSASGTPAHGGRQDPQWPDQGQIPMPSVRICVYESRP
jgi:hypothetical protein